jgi:uncharacterized membrane protein
MLSATAFSRATLVGIATGIRSMTPLAAVSWAASSGDALAAAPAVPAVLQRGSKVR